MTQARDNIYKGLGLFIEALRPYIVQFLKERAEGESWENLYIETLYDNQRSHWHHSRDKGQKPETLIDFQNLKGFALGYRNELKEDFDKDANRLPTLFDEIYEVRNKTYHHQDISDDEMKRAFNNMIRIMKKLGMKEMVEELIFLKEGKKEQKKKSKASKKSTGDLLPWFKNVRPHLDIRQGRLDESVFAANLGEVALETGREIYQNPALFFEKTFFTAGLKTVAKRVINGLSGGADTENRVISLQTGFGGGKTHTLISLFHLAKWGKKASESGEIKPLIDYTGEPKFDKANVAVFTNQTNDPVQGRETEEGIHIKTLWGELAYQLGGPEAYELIRANDENRTAPKGVFNKVLQKTKPGLILIDELADYCTSAATVEVGGSNLSDQTISFMQELSETIASNDRCVAVITLPASASEVGSSEQATKILTSLESRISRVGADTKPVADEEIFEVIRRRLFEDIGDEEEVENTISQYMQLYDSLRVELPSTAHRGEYRQKLKKSYPFHPELIDMFRIRWASHPDFQRTRGVLRLLASIVSDLWKRKGSLTDTNALIQTSDVNFGNLDALVGQLKKLYGNGYEAVITADVAGSSSNAFAIDEEKPGYGQYDLTKGICNTILLGTFGRSDANKGISIKEIKLCMLKPDFFNHNDINGALDVLESTAHYLYYSSSGTDTKRYWFRVQPNINILINQARNDVDRSEVDAEILKRIKNHETGVNSFNVLVDPPEDIPEQKKPTLIILGPQYQKTQEGLTKKTENWIAKLATQKGNSDRIYRNTLLFLVANELGYNKLKDSVTDYLASQTIRDDYQSQLESDQKDELKRKLQESSNDIDRRLVDTYVNIVKHSAKNGPQLLQVKEFKNRLDYQINYHITQTLITEEWLLEGVGYNTLKKYNLLPDEENPVKVQDVYETFLRYDDKPLITGPDAVRKSLLRYCRNGQLAIAAGESGDFSTIFFKQDIPFFEVTDETYWLVDESLYQPEDFEDEAGKPEDFDGSGTPGASEDDGSPTEDEETEQTTFKTLTISGKVGLENYTQLFSSFVRPLSNNNVQIEVTIKAHTTEANPITENSNQYKITKESANQLGLNFEAEKR